MELRKIGSEAESERKRRRNVIILSVIIIAILVFSTAEYFTGGNGEKGSVEEGKVVQEGEEWVLRYGEQTLRFSSSPEEAKNVSIDFSKKISDYYGRTVYIASDNDAATYEIAGNLNRYLERLQEACYGECEKNLPEKNCTDTLIVFNKSEENRVYGRENCVFIEGDLTSADAFLYKLFGAV